MHYHVHSHALSLFLSFSHFYSLLFQVRFLKINPSNLFSKYIGETSALVNTLFSLATKLSPCVIFVDELDALFRERSDTEHQVNRDLKTEFMSLWDGIESKLKKVPSHSLNLIWFVPS
jgi:SpoVK/Ycf46/Vps4 family AAA+-type ATPase